MKLKSAVFQNALKAAYSSLGTSATFSKAGIGFLSALQGYFLLIIDAVDSVSSIDETVFSFFKSLADSPQAAEKATFSFYKSLADDGYVGDAQVFAFFKSLTDTAIIPEQISKAFNKGNDDPVYLGDEHFTAYGKLVSDRVGVTDDVDGASSVLDDQEIQFFKVRVDVANATDTLALAMAFNRTHADTTTTLDQLVRALNKKTTSSAFFSDIQSRASNKTLGDSSTASDNQAFQFVKFHTDETNATDTLALAMGFNRNFTHTASSTDAGSLRNQGYADFTFFEEDYVGASRTFT